MEPQSPRQDYRKLSPLNGKLDDQLSQKYSPRSPANNILTEKSWEGSDREVQTAVKKKSNKISLPVISDGSLQSPRLQDKAPLLQKRSPQIKLSKLQINPPRNEFMNLTAGSKILSPQRKRSTDKFQEKSPVTLSNDLSDNQFDPPSPIPILSKHKKVQIEPEALWKQRRIRNQTNNKIKIDENNDALEDGSSPLVKKERRQKLLEAQSQLMSNADSITVSQIMPIQTQLYPKFFQYKVYECYKPQNLKSARDYISYLTKENYERTPELEKYLNQRLDTQLPAYVDQKKLLQFDSNFECGNLDSAYLIGENKYSLLLKVDTNTKGGSHWFYFKVLNWRQGQKVEFQIMNIVRNLEGFYRKGMKIYTRTENFKGTEQSDWIISDEIIEILGTSHQNPVVRKFNTASDPPTPVSYYNSLTFRCTFPDFTRQSSQKLNSHSVFCFAYALPYGFNDLTKDIKFAQDFLVEVGGTITYLQDLDFNFRESQVDVASNKTAGQAQGRIQQYVYENNVNQNLTKHEQKVIQNQTQDELDQQQRLISQVRNFSRIEINTSMLIYRQEVISISVGGLDVQQITITLQPLQGYPPIKKRKIIYVQARLHAAETYGSWAMKNMILQLVMYPEKYKYVLGHYIIKLIPMVNVDGVVIGNSRNSLVGVDLNRRWKEPNPLLHPEIYFIKSLMLEQSQTPRGISIFCDMHGHNKKENCFFFGCSKASDEAMISWTKTRLLPKIFASNEPIFDYNSCRFSQDRSKLTTARVVVWSEMKVTNSFTLEISMFGKNTQKTGKDANLTVQQLPHKVECVSEQFKPDDFLQLAVNFIKSIGQFTLVEKQLEKIEWLKPSILKGIAGVAARDKANLVNESSQQINGPKSGQISKTQRKLVTKKPSLEVDNKLLDQKIENDLTQFPDYISNTEKPKQSKKKPNAVRKFQSTRQVVRSSRDFTIKEPLTAIKTAKLTPRQSSSSSYTEPEESVGEENEQEMVTWKQFFQPEDIKSRLGHIIDQVKTGGDLQDSDDASDSQPSCDNYDENDFCDFFQKALKNGRKGRSISKPKNSSTKVTKPIIKLQVMDQSKIVVKKKPSNISDVQKAVDTVFQETVQDQSQNQADNGAQRFKKQRIHPTFLKIDSVVEKQLGIPENIITKEKDNNLLQLPTTINKAFSYRQQGVVNLQHFNSRQPNLENLQAAIDKLASPMTLIPSELRPIASKNQKQRETRQQYVLDQNLHQTEIQRQQERQKQVTKLASSHTFNSDVSSQPLSPHQLKKNDKQGSYKATELPSPNYASKAIQFAEQAQNNLKTRFPYMQRQDQDEVINQTKSQFDDSPAILQVLSPKRPQNVQGQKIVHQNIQQISGSIVINNYYSSQPPQVQRRNQRQGPLQSNVPRFEPPFEVTSLTKKTAVNENKNKQSLDNNKIQHQQNYFSQPRYSKLNGENVELLPLSGAQVNNKMQVSFVIKRKKQ